MTSKERITAVLSGKMPDMVPIYPKISFANVMTCPEKRISDYLSDPECMANACINAYRTFGWDGVALHSSIAWSGIAMGSDYVFPENDIPQRTACLINEFGDLSELDRVVVREPLATAPMSTLIEALRIVKKEIGDETYIMAWVDGPLNIASQLCKMDELMMGLLEEAEFCHALFAKCAEQSEAYAEALVAAGADIIAYGHATASSSIISRATYEEYALPYEKRLVEHIHGLGAKAVTHICGNIMPILDLIYLNGSDIIDFDSENDIEKMLEIAPGRIFRGSVSPTLLCNGTEEQIAASVKELLERTKNYPGYILGTGCEISINTPQKNIRAFVSAGKKFGMRG